MPHGEKNGLSIVFLHPVVSRVAAANPAINNVFFILKDVVDYSETRAAGLPQMALITFSRLLSPSFLAWMILFSSIR